MSKPKFKVAGKEYCHYRKIQCPKMVGDAFYKACTQYNVNLKRVQNKYTALLYNLVWERDDYCIDGNPKGVWI